MYLLGVKESARTGRKENEVMTMGEPRRLWNTISWNRKFSHPGNKKVTHNNAEIKEHFDKLRTTKGRPAEEISSDVYITLLEGDISRPLKVKYNGVV